MTKEEQTLSFSARSKEEIFQSRPSKNAHYRAFCYGLLLFGRRFSTQEVLIATEHLAVSKLCGFAIRDTIGIKAAFAEHPTRHKALLYTVSLSRPEDCARLLAAFSHEEGQINRALLEGEGFAAFLAGAFLTCGTVNEPSSSYHLEFDPPDGDLSDLLFELLSLAGYPPKATVRRGITVLYFKESEQIEDLLTTIGAPRCSLELMETKIYKDIRNRANRATNCETANIDKLVRASFHQLLDIALLREHNVFDTLPTLAQTVAALREEQPDASLAELAETLGVSRSGINHRLNQIAQAAKRLREEKSL